MSSFGIDRLGRSLTLIGLALLLAGPGAAPILWPTAVLAQERAEPEAPLCDQDKEAEAPKNRFRMTPAEFVEAAQVQFNRCHRHISRDESVPSTFRPNVDFPDRRTMLPDADTLPWKGIDPISRPEAYLNEVLDYALDRCGGDHVDWDGRDCGWFHAPWMHDLREPMRGLTEERSSRPGELHPGQTTETGNWAVSLYNEIGGHGFHRIWRDRRAYPKTKGFAFDDGTMAVKLLFSLATPEQVPYLRFAKTWKIHDGERIVEARLIQLDVLVKDEQVADGRNDPPHDDLSGWVMGSFLYNGSIETTPRCDRLGGDVEACEQARWRERLVPIGLQWGNDPLINVTGGPVQHWLNGDVTQMFANIRTMGGHPPYLGLDGRMNGPVDNHRSTCLACHGRAVDFGRHEEDALRLVPFVIEEGAAGQAEIPHFFRNLNSDQPFLDGTQSLDYSLQAMVGLQHYREWVDTQNLPFPARDDTSDVKPDYVSPYGISDELTIATWNIANLHHESGVALRSDAPQRQDVDFRRLAEMAAKIDADIVALQEIGSPSALARILPRETYHLVISDRYRAGDEFRPPAERDIFTAFAIRRSLFPRQPKVSTVPALSLPHFEYDDDFGTYEDRPTRSGMSVEFEFHGQKFSMLNVHLKSGCQQEELRDVSEPSRPQHVRYACRTLGAQLELMENWFELQHDRGRNVIMLGDFNRRLNDADQDGLDDFWEDLNDKRPVALVKGPEGPDTECWKGRQGAGRSHIDFIVVDRDILTNNVVGKPEVHDYAPDGDAEEYAGKGQFRLSDHCPRTLTLFDSR